MSLDGSTPNGAANDFFKFRFQQVVGFGSAEGDFQIAVVESTQFNSHGQAIALVMCLAIAGHTQQHANLKLDTLSDRPITSRRPEA